MGVGLDKFKTQVEEKVASFKEDKQAEIYKAQMKHIIEHIEDVCDDEYDALLQQEHKNIERMMKFLFNKARKVATNNFAMIDEGTVYGWVDEYVGTDDAEEYKPKPKPKTNVTPISKGKGKSKVKFVPKTKEDKDILDLPTDEFGVVRLDLL